MSITTDVSLHTTIYGLGYANKLPIPYQTDGPTMGRAFASSDGTCYMGGTGGDGGGTPVWAPMDCNDSFRRTKWARTQAINVARCI